MLQEVRAIPHALYLLQDDHYSDFRKLRHRGYFLPDWTSSDRFWLNRPECAITFLYLLFSLDHCNTSLDVQSCDSSFCKTERLASQKTSWHSLWGARYSKGKENLHPANFLSSQKARLGVRNRVYEWQFCRANLRHRSSNPGISDSSFICSSF